MDYDPAYMQRAIQLAGLGKACVAPNPMVGAVIVHDNKIIGEGYHRKYGGPHAEVNAVASVGQKSLLREATMYVNLEPCNHHGLTPACTNLIIQSGIPRLVIGQPDPNPLVAGKGIKRLHDTGIEVLTGVLESESRELNRRFNTFHERKRPYVILKWAKTSDGFVDLVRKKDDPIQPNWITDEYCRRLVHKWRSEESAIMVGTDTALKDNPKLNIRLWKGKDPLRIVLDRKLRLKKDLNLLDGSIPTIVYTSEEKEGKANLEYAVVDFDDNLLDSIMNDLYRRSIQSVIIEGGPKLLKSFIKCNLWDEARVFTGPLKFNQGVKAPDFPFSPIKEMETGNSKLEVYRNRDEC